MMSPVLIEENGSPLVSACSASCQVVLVSVLQGACTLQWPVPVFQCCVNRTSTTVEHTPQITTLPPSNRHQPGPLCNIDLPSICSFCKPFYCHNYFMFLPEHSYYFQLGPLSGNNHSSKCEDPSKKCVTAIVGIAAPTRLWPHRTGKQTNIELLELTQTGTKAKL